MVKITSVEKSSRAAKRGVREGDVLIAINDREINDVLDYRFFLTDTSVTLTLEREGKRFEVSIKKQQYDDRRHCLFRRI